MAHRSLPLRDRRDPRNRPRSWSRNKIPSSAPPSSSLPLSGDQRSSLRRRHRRRHCCDRRRRGACLRRRPGRGGPQRPTSIEEPSAQPLGETPAPPPQETAAHQLRLHHSGSGCSTSTARLPISTTCCSCTPPESRPDRTTSEHSQKTSRLTPAAAPESAPAAPLDEPAPETAVAPAPLTSRTSLSSQLRLPRPSNDPAKSHCRPATSGSPRGTHAASTATAAPEPTVTSTPSTETLIADAQDLPPTAAHAERISPSPTTPREARPSPPPLAGAASAALAGQAAASPSHRRLGSLRVRKVAPLAENYAALRRALRARYQSDSIDGVAKYLHDASLFYDSPRPSAEYAEARELVDLQPAGPSTLRPRGSRRVPALLPRARTDPRHADRRRDLQQQRTHHAPIRNHWHAPRARPRLLQARRLRHHLEAPRPTWCQHRHRDPRRMNCSNANECADSPPSTSSPERPAASHQPPRTTAGASSSLASPDAASIASALVLAPSRLASVAARVVAAALGGFDPTRVLPPSDLNYLRALDAAAPSLAPGQAPLMTVGNLFNLMDAADNPPTPPPADEPTPASSATAALFSGPPPPPASRPVVRNFLPPPLGERANSPRPATPVATAGGAAAGGAGSAEAPRETPQPPHSSSRHGTRITRTTRIAATTTIERMNALPSLARPALLCFLSFLCVSLCTSVLW